MTNIKTLPIKSGEFVSLEAVSGGIGAGASGDILTVTPPPGQRVRITHLSTSTSGIVTNATLSFDSLDILSSVSISGGAPNSALRYSIGNYQSYAAGNPPVGNHAYITGKTNEVFKVKSGVTTTTILYYAYEFGE